jgi:hypothetical protein
MLQWMFSTDRLRLTSCPEDGNRSSFRNAAMIRNTRRWKNFSIWIIQSLINHQNSLRTDNYTSLIYYKIKTIAFLQMMIKEHM